MTKTPQTTIRFTAEDLRPAIKDACARHRLATGEDVSMNDWIVEAIREKLAREGEGK